MVTLKAICDLFTQELGCTGDVCVEVIKQAEENCGKQAAGTGSLFDRADAVCALLYNCTAAEAVAFRSSDGGSSIGASSDAGGGSVVVAKRRKVQPAVAEEVALKLPGSVPGNSTQALWEDTLMPRGELSPAQSAFYHFAQEEVRPFIQEKLAAKGIPKKGIRLEQALKLMLSAPHLSTTLQEPPCKDAFMNLSGNACVRGCPSWDDKAAELAGLLLWFSLPQTDSSSPLELYQTHAYSKDYHLRLRQPTNASKPAALTAAHTPAAPEHYEAGATPASETDVPPASEAGSDSALGGSTQASHAAAAPQTPAGPVAPAAPEAAPASTSTAARKQPAADQSN